MHEMSIAQSIVEIVEEEMNRHHIQKLKKIFVKIGELVAVVPESLQFCYKVLTEEGPLKGTELVIENVPVKAFCQSCQKEFHSTTPFFTCPYCGSPHTKVLQGQELQVYELEVEE